MASAFLDTTIAVDLLRDYQPASDWVSTLGTTNLMITSIAWM